MTGDDRILRVDISDLSLAARTSGPRLVLTIDTTQTAIAATTSSSLADVEVIIEISDLGAVARIAGPRLLLVADNTANCRVQREQATPPAVANVASLGTEVAHTHRSSARLERQRDRSLITKGTLIIYGLLLGALLLLVGLHLISVGESLQLATGFGAPLVALLGYFGRKSATH